MISSRKDSVDVKLPSYTTMVGPKLTNDFMENKLVWTNPAFKNLEAYRTANAHYDVEMPCDPEPLLESDVTRQRRLSLRAAIEDYYRAGAKDDEMPRLDLERQYPVSSVLQELRSLQDLHRRRKTQKPWWKSLENCCANFANHEKDIAAWMRLLPSESWQGSLVCGGLKIVFSAIARVGHFRTDIGQILERIPFTIQRVYEYVRMYKDRGTFVTHMTNVYVCIMEVLQQCVKYYAEKTWKHLIASFGAGDQYGAELKERFARLKELETRMDQSAAIQSQANVVRIENELIECLHKMLSDDEKKDKSVRELEEQLSTMREEKASLEGEKAMLKQREQELCMQKRVDIRRYIEYDEYQCLIDRKECLQMTPVSFPDARERTNWMLGSQELQGWADGSMSEVLVVNASEELHGAGESAVSMFSAALLQSLHDTHPESVKLFWFAGRNIHSTPVQMASALLGQLLDQGKAVPSAAVMNKVDLLHLRSLHEVVKLLKHWLRAQLQDSDVFCICDSVSCYEDYRRDGLLSIYDTLMDITEERGSKHKIKVVLTSPTGCRYIGTQLDERTPSTIVVPELI